VFISTSGGEWATRLHEGVRAETGAPLWTWYTIPSPEEGGWWGDWTEKAPGTELSLNRDIAREKADSAKYADSWQRGGGPIWMPATIDPALGLLYVSVGNVNPDYNGVTRPGDNRWSSSICALRIADGSRAWCWQWMPHDVWDYDGASPTFLFDLERQGTRIPALGVFTKLGFLYVLDRTKGELLTRSDAYVPHKNLFKVPTAHDSLVVAPGSAGGTNWSPGAYSPLTRLAYTAAIDWPMITMADAGETCPAGHLCVGGALAIAPGEGSARGTDFVHRSNTGKVAGSSTRRFPSSRRAPPRADRLRGRVTAASMPGMRRAGSILAVPHRRGCGPDDVADRGSSTWRSPVEELSPAGQGCRVRQGTLVFACRERATAGG
jgi:hypothetical protein